MNCLKPVKVSLPQEEQERRMALDPALFPYYYRMATYVYVPCGKCEACLSKRRTAWTMRLNNELKDSDSCYFITLTYDEDNVPWKFVNIGGYCTLVQYVSKKDCQNFLKRLRKAIQPFKVRYFLVSEYGPQTMRPHYHMILFNFPHELKAKIDEYINNAWGLGFIQISPISSARINYVTSYCLDSSTLPEYLDKNFMLCSRKPGIGLGHICDPAIVDYYTRNMDGLAILENNGKPCKVSMPRYYRDKLFDRSASDEITCKNIKVYADLCRREQKEQREWLKSHGYPTTREYLNSPIDGSPLSLKLQSQENFKRKVQSKNKMNKKKL
ncbi:replication initiator protein [Dipodfec virus UA23Rod_1340]|uniref:Replication initiator protein n=1 Tax=Dipodfec virus UA23Rod_1340 TaxID=2929330 RepID=A0A976N1S1_9VIRU|nr:replication initiator protein [Dipodfec virus UA23Rod_1340]